MVEFFAFAGFVVVVVLSVVGGIWLYRGRCPVCGKYLAGRVVGSSNIGSTTSTDFAFDHERGHYRNITTHHTGFLIKRRCRFCKHEWERLETRSKQLDRLSTDAGKEYRKHRGW